MDYINKRSKNKNNKRSKKKNIKRSKKKNNKRSKNISSSGLDKIKIIYKAVKNNFKLKYSFTDWMNITQLLFLANNYKNKYDFLKQINIMKVASIIYLILLVNGVYKDVNKYSKKIQKIYNMS